MMVKQVVPITALSSVDLLPTCESFPTLFDDVPMTSPLLSILFQSLDKNLGTIDPLIENLLEKDCLENHREEPRTRQVRFGLVLLNECGSSAAHWRPDVGTGVPYGFGTNPHPNPITPRYETRVDDRSGRRTRNERTTSSRTLS
jgi:hypothetical protein